MKIALSADGAEFGGAEQSLVNLVRKAEDRHRFVLVGPDCAAMQGLHERMPALPANLIRDRGWSLRRKVASHREALREHRPDVVQVTLCNPGAGLAAQFAGFAERLPTIAIEQLVQPVSGRRHKAKMLASRLVVDHVAVGGASAREVERLFALPDSSVRTIYNGVPDRGRATVAPTASHDAPGGGGGGRHTIGTVGRLEHQKGYHRLIDALVQVPNAELVLVGDGSLRGDLEGQVDTLGLNDRVRFLGWLDDPTATLATFDLFVLPSRNEAFPLTIVEAMLAGVPVVATDVGSVSEAVIHDETGWLVPEGDVDALASTLTAALADDEARRMVADRARKRSQLQFTDAAMADRYCEMWESPRGRLPLRHAVPRRSTH